MPASLQVDLRFGKRRLSGIPTKDINEFYIPGKKMDN